MTFLGFACLSACGATPVAPLTTKDRNRAELDRIAEKCGLLRQNFRLLGEDHVELQPAPDANYESVDCALGKFKGKSAFKLGFVGNAYYGETH